MEDGSTLLLTPALFRRWHQGERPILVRGLPTHFGELDLSIQPAPTGDQLNYGFRITPRGDQAQRELSRLVLYPRSAGGRPIDAVSVDGKPATAFTDAAVIIPGPDRGREIKVTVKLR